MKLSRQFFRYMAVGIANTGLHFLIINALSISFGIYAGGKLALINGFATAVVLCQSYVLNRYWTFSSTNRRISEFSRFLLVNAGAALLHSAIVYAVTTHVPRPAGVSPLLWENAAAVMGLGAVVLWNFTGFRMIVFQQRNPANDFAAAKALDREFQEAAAGNPAVGSDE